MRHLAALLLLASQAGACPTAETLENGITFVRSDGSRQDHRAIGDGVIEVSHVRSSGVQNGFAMTLHGLHNLRSHRGGTRPEGWAIPDFTPVSPPQLDTEQRREVPLGVMVLRTLTYTQPVPVQKRISGCVFEVYRVAQFETGLGHENFRAYDWYPALGTGVLVAMRMGTLDEITAGVESLRWRFLRCSKCIAGFRRCL